MFCLYSNWLSSPLTFAITLAAGILLLISVVVLSGPRGGRGAGRRCPNPTCGHANPIRARYCARCGHELTDSGRGPHCSG